MVGVELVDHERAVQLEQEAFRRGQIDIAIDILDGVLATMAA